MNNLASASTIGVLPEPPATRLPTQRTGTGARKGRATARRNRAAIFQAAPTGASRSAARPGGSCQNSGARIGMAKRRAIGHVRPVQDRAIEPCRFKRVVSAVADKGTADEGDAGQPEEQTELA